MEIKFRASGRKVKGTDYMIILSNKQTHTNYVNNDLQGLVKEIKITNNGDVLDIEINGRRVAFIDNTNGVFRLVVDDCIDVSK